MGTKDLYKKHYMLRRPFPGSNSVEVTIPYIVIEREATKNNLTVEEFIAQFECECLFDGIEGLLYRFCRKPRRDNGQT